MWRISTIVFLLFVLLFVGFMVFFIISYEHVRYPRSHFTDIESKDVDKWLPAVFERKTQDEMVEFIRRLDKAFEKHNIQYFLSCGSMIGIARHGGPIPWDNDIDLFILGNTWEEVQAALSDEDEERGTFRTTVDWVGWIVQTLTGGQLRDVSYEDLGTHADVIFAEVKDGWVQPKSAVYRWLFEGDRYEEEYVFPLERKYHFGDVLTYTPRDMKSCLDKGYKNWDTEVYLQIYHSALNKGFWSHYEPTLRFKWDDLAKRETELKTGQKQEARMLEDE
jgi:hypothetical protein